METPPSSRSPKEKPEPLAGRGATFARQLALAMELPFVLVATVVIGGAVGYWLDQRFHTSPLFLLVLGALGLAAGVRDIIRRLSGSGSGHGA